MEVVSSIDPNEWPSTEQWTELLPSWFVESFRPEPSPEQLDEELKFMRILPLEQRAKWGESKWDFKSWVYWFQPGNRYWFWWDAALVDENTIMVALEVTDWPFPWDELKWLFRAAGATSVEAEE